MRFLLIFFLYNRLYQWIRNCLSFCSNWIHQRFFLFSAWPCFLPLHCRLTLTFPELWFLTTSLVSINCSYKNDISDKKYPKQINKQTKKEKKKTNNTTKKKEKQNKKQKTNKQTNKTKQKTKQKYLNFNK